MNRKSKKQFCFFVLLQLASVMAWAQDGVGDRESVREAPQQAAEVASPEADDDEGSTRNPLSDLTDGAMTRWVERPKQDEGLLDERLTNSIPINNASMDGPTSGGGGSGSGSGGGDP